MAGNAVRTRMTAVAPAVESIQDLVAEANRDRTPLRIAGRSLWIDAQRPVTATRILSTTTHSGIVDYVPGDLTITVRSGTTLHEVEEATRAQGQWFPLDPYGSPERTIGATIATGSFGPLASSFGRARDLVLGVEFVTGEGKVVRGGGRVVKNVAGYDLVRLITGSWGTLGVITEATLRLYALPQEMLSLSLGIPDGLGALRNRIASVLDAPGIPFCVELVNAALAERIGLSREPQLLVKIGGNSAGVAAQRAAMNALGGARIFKSEVWDSLRTVDGSATSVVRLSTLPGKTAELWIGARDALRDVPNALMHSTPSLGVVRCVLPTGSIDLMQKLSALTSSVVYERMPAEQWNVLSSTVVGDRISQGIKKAFDPSNILNPGILGPIV